MVLNDKKATQMRIALLEDDLDQAEVIKIWLEANSWTVSHFTHAASLIEAVPKNNFDLFLLDWKLPDKSGLEVLEWLRRHLDWTVPVVFLTAKDLESDIVRALAAGADDYIVKPLSEVVTLARIRAVLRRSGHSEDQQQVIQLDPYRIDLMNQTVKIDNEMIPLTRREFELTAYLFSHAGRVLSRDALLSEVWGVTASINTRTVDTHISRVRSKLLLNGHYEWKLISIYQYGYRLEKVSDTSAAEDG